MEATDVVMAAPALPKAGTWTFSPAQTEIGFVARKLRVSKVRGHFEKFDGSVTFAEDPARTQIEVRIDAASLDTNDATRDKHLKGPDFFDAEQFPTITFKSRSVDTGDGSNWTVTGDLTIKDITRPVNLDVEYLGTQPTPWGFEQAVFTAQTEINREDWGLTWNAALEAGGFLVGPTVKIEVEAAVKPS